MPSKSAKSKGKAATAKKLTGAAAARDAATVAAAKKTTTAATARRPQPRKKRRTSTDLQGTTAAQTSYLDAPRLASEELSPAESSDEGEPPAQQNIQNTASRIDQDGNDGVNPNEVLEAIRATSSTVVLPTLASASATAASTGQPADLQGLLAEALQALAKERAEKEETEKRLADEKRNRAEAEALVREAAAREEQRILGEAHPAVRDPVITSKLKGRFRRLNIRSVLGLQKESADVQIDNPKLENLKDCMWRWLQSTARLVVAWGQMHLKEELQVEDVPAWQTLSTDQRKALMSEFSRRIREKPSAKSLFYTDDASRPNDGVSIYENDWIYKEMLMIVMNNITDTDTAHKNLGEDSNLPADDAVVCSQWPPPRATELLVAVTPRNKVVAPRRARRKRQGTEKARAEEGEDSSNNSAQDAAGGAACAAE